MSVPDVSLSVRDGALGVIPNLAASTCIKLGTCSLGTVGTVYSFSDATQLVNTLGQGPLVEAAARSLTIAGGPVLCLPVNPSVAGAAGAVTKVGTGTSTQTVSGAPYDAWAVTSKIVTGAASLGAGTATFQYTLDGGTNWSPLIAVPTSGIYAIPNTNLTLTWGAGTFVAGDTYSFATTAPGYALADLTAAITTALASSYFFRLLHVVGPAASAAAAAAMVASVETQMAGAAAAYRYLRALVEVPQDTDANLLTAFAAVAAPHVVVCAGFATVTSVTNGRQLSRSSAWPISERAALVRPGTDKARVADGSLPGVVAISRDERATPGLDDARFATLRTIVGRQGYYINNARLMSASGSDYIYLQYGQVMDVFADTLRQALLTFLNDSVTVDSTTGYIVEKDARSIEAYCEDLCRSQLTRTGDASDLSVTVSRTSNIISTSNLPVSGRVVPKGYNKAITVDVGYTNPSLQLKAA